MKALPYTYKTIRGLLTDKARWTKGNCALDKQGEVCWVESDEASCFCLFGAINKVYKTDEYARVYDKLTKHIQSTTCFCSMPEFNDNSTHEEVLALVMELKV